MEKYVLEMSEDAKDRIENFIKAYDLDAHIAKAEQPKEEQWPQNGDMYFRLDDTGCIYENKYLSGSFDDQRIAIGNCFKTIEEAEFEVEQLKVLVEMKKFAEPKDMKWDGHKNRWSIFINVDNGGIYYTSATTYKSNAIYFESREKAEECVKAVGEDRIKKYYIGE